MPASPYSTAMDQLHMLGTMAAQSLRSRARTASSTGRQGTIERIIFNTGNASKDGKKTMKETAKETV